MQLYKYRDFDNCRWKTILRDNELFFALPKDLNDPFECKPLVTAEGTRQDYVAYATAVANEYHLAPEILESSITGLVERLESPAERESIYYNKVVGNLGICSFAATPDNLLLWAHYADHHRGFCVEFSPAEALFDGVFEVHYKSERPKLDLLQTRDPNPNSLDILLNNGLLTKSQEWHYEKEYRAIRFGGPGLVSFPGELITAVILGARITSENEKRIFEILEQREAPLNILRAHLAPNEFKLLIERVS